MHDLNRPNFFFQKAGNSRISAFYLITGIKTGRKVISSAICAQQGQFLYLWQNDSSLPIYSLIISNWEELESHRKCTWCLFYNIILKGKVNWVGWQYRKCLFIPLHPRQIHIIPKKMGHFFVHHVVEQRDCAVHYASGCTCLTQITDSMLYLHYCNCTNSEGSHNVVTDVSQPWCWSPHILHCIMSLCANTHTFKSAPITRKSFFKSGLVLNGVFSGFYCMGRCQQTFDYSK